jgi:hypothetical protein
MVPNVSRQCSYLVFKVEMSTGKVRQIREDKKAADGRAKKTNDGR